MKKLQLIATLTIVAASAAIWSRGQSAPTSMELFQKGGTFYLKRDYPNAALYFQQALELEKQNPSLPHDYWRAMVDDLAMSYGIPGDLKRAKEVIEYGISKDPKYPNFYYTLACVYAEMDDLDRTLENLKTALTYKANVIPGEHLPDPRNDDSFRRFRNDKRFQDLMVSFSEQYPSEITLESAPGADSSQKHDRTQTVSQPCTETGRMGNAGPAGRPRSPALKAPRGRTVYFVPFGQFPRAEIDDLVAYYNCRFGLAIEVLPSIDFPGNAFNPSRQQFIAEALVAGMRRTLAKRAGDPNSVLIGFTSQDIYPANVNWSFAFGWRLGGRRSAVVSTARMDLHYPEEPFETARPEIRLRKMVTRDIGILYYGLAQSDNPRSVLFDKIMGIQELDAVGEDF